MIKEYIAYLKDNPEGYWFKAKLYGWGWTPATRQGWFTMLFFIALIAANAYRIDTVSHLGNDMLINFILETALLIGVFITICWKKGERPRWQWGLKK